MPRLQKKRKEKEKERQVHFFSFINNLINNFY